MLISDVHQLTLLLVNFVYLVLLWQKLVSYCYSNINVCCVNSSERCSTRETVYNYLLTVLYIYNVMIFCKFHRNFRIIIS